MQFLFPLPNTRWSVAKISNKCLVMTGNEIEEKNKIQKIVKKFNWERSEYFMWVLGL